MKQFLHVLIALCLSAATQAKGKLDPLTEAAGAGELERVAKLLDEGAAVEGNGRFATPLYYAATARQIEVVRLLLQHGADIDSQRFSSGRTALMGAALVGDAQIVKLLLDKEANPLLRGWMLHTALDTARRERHADVAQLLEPVTKSTVSAGELQQLNVQFLVILDALQHPSGKLMGMPGYLGCREKATFKRNGKWQTLPKVAFLAVIDSWRLQAGEFQRIAHEEIVYYPPHSSWLFEEQPLDDGGVSVIGKVFLSDAKSNNVEEVRITFVRDDTGTWHPQGSSLKG